MGNGGGGETLASQSITLNNAAALVFSQSDSLTVGGFINGSGSLTQTGPGLLILTGNNIYTGLTTISGGTLQVGSGDASGSISGNVLDNAVLVYDLSTSATVAGTISGSGSLRRSAWVV